ncbi:hypothetical protein C0Q70_09889 [Pomacea canaliculata]|uniref:Sideroflexin n=1 Tax=Pomacea canaliculata TaxID=400727 RepID=A0A2T7PB28_POMCA|nr:hypothetical protein C0Q70_09889 [Pomacea canaliculata]
MSATSKTPVSAENAYPPFQLGKPRFDQDLSLLEPPCPHQLKRFVMGYVGAVTSAVSIAAGLSLLIRRASAFSHTTKMLIQRFVPFPAVATASTCNVVLMRNSELVEGIEVFDRNGRVIGTSKAAAKKTALTRMFLPAPILIIPPVVMSFLEKTKFLKTYPRMHLPINSVVCTLAFGFALPVAIALFPQVSHVSVPHGLFLRCSRFPTAHSQIPLQTPHGE